MSNSLFCLALGVAVAACSRKDPCVCQDQTLAMLPAPIDVSEEAITFEVEWDGGTTTCTAGTTTPGCQSAFVNVIYDEETLGNSMGGTGIGQGGKRLPIVLGVAIDEVFDAVHVTFSGPERSFSTHGSPIDSEEGACEHPCTIRELLLIED